MIFAPSQNTVKDHIIHLNPLSSFWGAFHGEHKLQMWRYGYDFREIDITVPMAVLNVGIIHLAKNTDCMVGRVVDNLTNEPIVGAKVNLDSGKNNWRTKTDEQGRFMLIQVTAGSHLLQVSNYGYDNYASRIRVQEGDYTDVGDVGLAVTLGSVRGQVIDARSGRPVMGAHVQYDGGGQGRVTTTNINGRFILPNVPRGNHIVQVWGNAYSFAQKVFNIRTGQAVNVDTIFIEPIGGTVSGRLVDAVNGLPIYNGVIQLDGGGYPPNKTTSALNGDFIMYNVTGGNHLFQTWGYAYQFLEQEITSTAGESKYLGDIALQPDPYTFNGRIIDFATMQPIEGAKIILTGEGQEITTYSYPDGRFVLLNVPQGYYDITAEWSDYDLLYMRVFHPGENKNVDLGDIILERHK